MLRTLMLRTLSPALSQKEREIFPALSQRVSETDRLLYIKEGGRLAGASINQGAVRGNQ